MTEIVAPVPVVGNAEAGVSASRDFYGEVAHPAGILLSAYRGGEEPFRIERLCEVVAFLDAPTQDHIIALHDHKGELSVLWGCRPTEDDHEEVFECWADQGEMEDQVVSIDRDTGREYYWADVLHAMPYRQYLSTHHWRRERGRAIQRAGSRCQLCNRTGALNVHHRTYDRRGFELDGDLIVLCAGCHAKFHDKIGRNGHATD